MGDPHLVGFRFLPTDEEICSLDPGELALPSSSIRKDYVWYFFRPDDNTYNKGQRQSRKQISGFWKKTKATINMVNPKAHAKKEEELSHQQCKPTTRLKTPTVSLTVNGSAFTKNKQSTDSAIKLENRFSLLAENDI